MEIEKIAVNLTHRKCVVSLCQRFLHLRQSSKTCCQKYLYEVPDVRCVCAQVSILLLTASEIIAHNMLSSVLKVTSLSSFATFREQ